MGARFSVPVQTGPGAHPASCTMGTGFFPGVMSSRGMTLTPHTLLMPWSWKGRAIPLLPVLAVRPVQSLSTCTREHFTLPCTFYLWFTFSAHRWHKNLPTDRFILQRSAPSRDHTATSIDLNKNSLASMGFLLPLHSLNTQWRNGSSEVLFRVDLGLYGLIYRQKRRKLWTEKPRVSNWKLKMCYGFLVRSFAMKFILIFVQFFY